MVSGGIVRVTGWPQASIQPAEDILAILEKLGSVVRQGSSYLEVQGARTYGGFDVDLHDVGELTPAVAALAALAVRRRGVAAQRGSPPARPRDGPARGVVRRNQRSRRAVRGNTRRPAHHRAAVARRRVARHMPTTGWRPRAPSSGCGCPASRWKTLVRRRRRCRNSRRCGPRCSGQTAESGPDARGQRPLSPREYDESDVRVRPGRGSRPRTKTRPEHADAQEAMVVTVDRGRWGCALGRRPRPPGHRHAGTGTRPHADRRRRRCRHRRRPVRAARHAGPHRAAR